MTELSAAREFAFLHFLHLHLCVCVCVCVCLSVCLLVRNLGEYFVSLLDEPSYRKNASPSDKQLW